MRELKACQAKRKSTATQRPTPPPPAAPAAEAGPSAPPSVGAVFRSFDKSGSGTLGRVEVVEALGVLGIPPQLLRTPAASAVFAQHAKDPMSLPDFRPLVKALRNLPPAPAAAPSVGQVFRSYDKDGSGDLDVAEVKLALAELGLPAETAEAAAILAKYDEDGSGRLSLKEYAAAEDRTAHPLVDRGRR